MGKVADQRDIFQDRDLQILRCFDLVANVVSLATRGYVP